MLPHLRLTVLVFIAVALTTVILAIQLWPRPRLYLVRWTITAGVLLALSYTLAQLGGSVYNDPRPFTSSHIAPLIPHAADNGFPSDHALLAAALVALLNVWWSLPLVVLAVLVDWARVGAGIHHVVDVAGSSVFVAFATLVSIVIVPLLVCSLTSNLPSRWILYIVIIRRHTFASSSIAP